MFLIQELNEAIALVVSLFLNFTLLLIVYKKTTVELKNYSVILVIFAVGDIFFSLVLFICQTVS